MCDLKKHLDEHPLPHGFFKSRRRRLPEQGGRHHTLPEALTPERDAFNYVHSHRRLCIERAFGLLYARFKVLAARWVEQGTRQRLRDYHCLLCHP